MNTEQNRKGTEGKRPRFLKGMYRRTREGCQGTNSGKTKQNQTDKEVGGSNITQLSYSLCKGKSK